MKATTSALLTYLNGLRPTGDAPLLAGNLFTFWLADGTTLAISDLDIPVAWNGLTFLANSLLVSGLRYKCSLGLGVDKQQIVISARASDTIGGAPFLQALQQGIFDGATIRRERAFFSSFGAARATPIGTVVMFKGRVANIDEIGRTTAKMTVASDLVFLDIDMPRNVWAPNCLHTLYDSGCGRPRGTYSGNGTVGSGSSNVWIAWGGASADYAQGAITFTSGANSGVVATIKTANSSGFLLAYPLSAAPAAGDAFTAAQGCDHTMSTCQNRFGNLANFRGFPFVPPPQIMTGPLSTTQAVSTKGK